MSGPQPQQKKRRRRRSKKSGQQQHQDLWHLVPALPDPEPIRPSPDPRMVIRSLGDPPLAGQGAVAEHYIGAVVDRAAALATALAAAAGLLAEADDDED